MSLRYLLDTNVISEPLRPEPNAGVMRRLRAHESEIAIPAPVWHELRLGAARLPPSNRRTAIERYLDDVVLPNFPVIEYDQHAAEWHALERARLVALGRTPPFVDGQIAAISRVQRLTLISANANDFSAFEGLRVRTWM